MADSSASSTPRIIVLVVLALSLLIFAIQLTIVRPRLWPAGVGVTLSGDTIFASLAEPRPVARIRPPDITGAAGTPVVVTRVAPDGAAARIGLTVGAAVGVSLGPDQPTATRSASAARIATFPETTAEILKLWRDAYRRGPSAQVTIAPRTAGGAIPLTPQPVWAVDPATQRLWARQHLGVLLQMGAFLAGAILLAWLGARGMTASLMTLALVGTAIANGGPMFGAEQSFPLVGDVVLIFGWLATPLSFPTIGLAVLHFPSRAAILDRYTWIYPALAVIAAPMLIISVTTAAFLLGADAALGPLSWFATHGWIFDASFAVALAANVLIVIEGIGRYHHNLDANERRRIQIVVFTGVAAVFGYAIKAGVPLLSSLAGRPVELNWAIEAILQTIVLLPAFALPYAVAVKHVFSPRTVIRSGLQYAFARRTLSVLVLLPLAVLAFSLIRERQRPLGDIVLAQPWFYAISLGLAALGFRYRDQARRWLDRRFFRAEYDAREILVALANRVPYENDPSQLVALVTTQIDNALHPESIAVMAAGERRLEVVAASRAHLEPLDLDGGLATLLKWSDEPLEIFLDDDRSPVARLPPADRAWLEVTGVALLVPMFAGTGGARILEGMIALGPKRSEEPYTPEDRTLLSGIAAQLSVAHDLSRLRKRASSDARSLAATPDVTPTMVAGTSVAGVPTLAMCPVCHRCFNMAALRGTHDAPHCPDDSTALQPVIGMPPVVDGKYRVDAVVGRGGMGAVFRARDLRLDRDVAVKVVRAEAMANSESKARFQREAQIVARLQHPSIVTVFDYGDLSHGAAFLVMEFVAGEDLRHLLKREGPLAPERALDLIAGVAAGVDAAHQAGILHRDLKPENILLPKSGTGPKVLDFGVAKMTSAGTGDGGVTLTHGVTIVGTPAYMAPEQLRGEPLDPRADVYSLAVVTYELVTGQLPYGTGSVFDVGLRQADGTTRVPFDAVPPPLEQALRQGLSLNRDERPESASALVERLRFRPSPPAPSS